jgi:hypothetical protein
MPLGLTQNKHRLPLRSRRARSLGFEGTKSAAFKPLSLARSPRPRREQSHMPTTTLARAGTRSHAEAMRGTTSHSERGTEGYRHAFQREQQFVTHQL